MAGREVVVGDGGAMRPLAKAGAPRWVATLRAMLVVTGKPGSCEPSARKA